MDEIPFFRQFMAPNASKAVSDSLAMGALAGNGKMTAECERHLARLHPDSRPFLTTSCTAALEMAALILDLNAGDEVILPSWTFASSANAIALRGATPVFVDVDMATLNINPSAVEAAISSKTKAIMCVHYAGVACDMDSLLSLCEINNIFLIEDAAQAIGATWKGKPLGAIGDLGAFSFHGTKNLSCGEGGALMVQDATLVPAAELAWEKGTNRLSFLRGEVDYYDWCTLGSSYLPSEMTAALLDAQLGCLETINGARIQAWERYKKLFSSERFAAIDLLSIPNWARHNGHLFAIRMQSNGSRDAILNFLLSKGVDARVHYQPLHLSPAGRRYGRTVGPLPVTEAAAQRLLRLPIDSIITELEQIRVAEVLAEGINRFC